MGGQAFHMRGEPNAFGFATKHTPGYDEETELFLDSDTRVKGLIDAELANLKLVLDTHDYFAVVFPTDGIGTGLSRMPEFAPEYLEYHTSEIFKLIRTHE
jgi:hypothetical protein